MQFSLAFIQFDCANVETWFLVEIAYQPTFQPFCITFEPDGKSASRLLECLSEHVLHGRI